MRKSESEAAEAESKLRRATQLLPDLAAPWSSLANHYQRNGKLTAAIEAWQAAVNTSEKPWVPLQSLGYAFLQAHRPLDALDAFRSCGESLPIRPELVVNNAFQANTAHGLAQSWRAIGDLQQSIYYEERAVHLLPSSPTLWRSLSHLYFEAGRPKDALDAIKMVNPKEQ